MIKDEAGFIDQKIFQIQTKFLSNTRVRTSVSDPDSEKKIRSGSETQVRTTEEGWKQKARQRSFQPFLSNRRKQLARKGILNFFTPKQTRQPWPCLLFPSFFYGKNTLRNFPWFIIAFSPTFHRTARAVKLDIQKIQRIRIQGELQ